MVFFFSILQRFKNFYMLLQFLCIFFPLQWGVFATLWWFRLGANLRRTTNDFEKYNFKRTGWRRAINTKLHVNSIIPVRCGDWRGGYWNCQGNRRTTLSPPSPASVIAERSASHAAQHKRLSAGERKPYFDHFSLFAAICEPSKKSSTYRTPPSPQKSHYGLAASWGQPVIRLKTLRRRRRVRHWRTRRALCVFFLSFFFQIWVTFSFFLPLLPPRTRCQSALFGNFFIRGALIRVSSLDGVTQ